MASRRVLTRISLNGRHTYSTPYGEVSYDDAMSQECANHWSSTEYNGNNAWYVDSSNGNTWNNNKYNNYQVRAAVAHDDFQRQLSAIHEAFDDCKRGKLSSSHTLDYLQIADTDLPKLARELYTKTYKPTTSTCFLVHRPKLREVFAADFRDRIIHHWIILRLEPLFEERFQKMGNVSYNCRKGFGTLKAIQAAEEGMREVSCGYTKQAYVFKGDLVSFFMSIERDRLWYLLERLINRRYHAEDKDILLYAVKTIVFHHPEENCVINGNPDEWKLLPKNKSLFGIDKNHGGPIGNHTTQQFANFYLSVFLDLYVLYLFRGRNYRYIRFVDDFLLVCDDKDFLLRSIPKIDATIKRYGLLMHKDKRYIQPVSHGVLFVGGYIKPCRTYVGNRLLGNFARKIHEFRNTIDHGGLTLYDLEHIEQVVNSYLGFLVHHRSYRIRRLAILSLGKVFWKYFIVRGHYESVRIRNKYLLRVS